MRTLLLGASGFLGRYLARRLPLSGATSAPRPRRAPFPDVPGVSWLTMALEATDAEALEAFQTLARLEGILPALESAHAIAHARGFAKQLGPDGLMLISLSGRGDKDVNTVEKTLEKLKT